MCGIAGYFGLKASPGLLDRMADEQRQMFSGLREDLVNAESPAEGYDSGMATDFRQRLTADALLREFFDGAAAVPVASDTEAA